MVMARRGSARLLAVAAVVMLVAPGASAAGPPPSAGDVNPVTTWNRIAANTLVLFPGAAGGAPPALQINMGMVAGRGLRRGQRDRRRSIIGRTSSRGASPRPPRRRPRSRPRHTASSPASSRRCRRASRSRTGRALLQALDARVRHRRSRRYRDGPFKRQGIAAGNAAADAMIAARQGDGRFGPSPWVPNSTPGTGSRC